MKLPTDKEIAHLMRLLSDSSQVNVFIVQLNASALFVGKHQARKMVKCTKMNPVTVLFGGVKQHAVQNSTQLRTHKPTFKFIGNILS